MEMTKTELDLMDKIVNVTYINLYTMFQEHSNIILDNFDFNNPEHLFILEVANMINNFTEYNTIKIVSNFFKIKWHNLFSPIKVCYLSQKEFEEYKRGHGTTVPYDVNAILGFMKEECQLEDDFFAKIYHTYFKKISKKQARQYLKELGINK